MEGLGKIQDTGQAVYPQNIARGKAVESKENGNKRTGQEKAPEQVVLPTTDDAAVSVETIFKWHPKHDEITTNSDSADSQQIVLKKSITEWVKAVITAIEEGSGETMFHSDGNVAALNARIDRSFGVEKLSYKQMWKVLKTVVKEISEFREANTGRFTLGVNQQLDTTTILMEFTSLADFLSEKLGMSPEIALSNELKDTTAQIVSDPAASLEAQANIVPQMASQLLIHAK